MPVALYDLMRPVAIAAGLGIAVGGERGASLLSSGLGGIAFGLAGFVIFGRVAKLWFAQLSAPSSQAKAGERSAASEASFCRRLHCDILRSASRHGSRQLHWQVGTKRKLVLTAA